MLRKQIIALLLSLLCFSQASSQGFPPPNVNVVSAEMRMLSPVNWVSGTVVSRNNSKLAAEVSGRLTSIAELGSRVKQGDVIAQIDDTSLKIQFKENQASVENAKAKLEFQESEVKRISALAKRNLSATNDLEQAVSSRDIARGELAAAEARLAQTQQNMEFTQLKAPFDGLVAERLSNQGEFVNNGTAIVRLVETANLEASLFAPLTAYRFLKQEENLRIDSPLGKGKAPIKSLVPVADSRSHLMEVRLNMSNFDWPVGLSLKAAIASGLPKEVLAIPRDALILRREGTFVYRITPENKSEQLPVSVGIGAGEYIEVIGDLNEGDRIVVRGAERLRPGQTVNVKTNNSELISGKQ